MSRTAYTLLERSVIGLILLGMTGMFQPFSPALFRYGFVLLLVSTLAFIVVSHLTPREREP